MRDMAHFSVNLKFYLPDKKNNSYTVALVFLYDVYNSCGSTASRMERNGCVMAELHENVLELN